MNSYKKLREEALKSEIRQDYFNEYKYTQLGNIDFVIAKHAVENKERMLFEDMEAGELKSLLWAEAKQGTAHDIYESFVQLILTIGKERTFEKYLPPKYIGAFDAEKFAFIEYHEVQHIFYQNDFNWNVTPSNHESKEFKQLYELCRNALEVNSILFKYEDSEKEFKAFIKLNFKSEKEVTEKISVTKNNFTFVFQRWSEKVKPTIGVDWEKSNKAGIISADFFLADLLSEDNESLKDSLYVVLKKTRYELAKKIDESGFEEFKTVSFNDKQKAYKEFWNIYARPPREEYWDYIISRRDLLVPQDIRERKGSFFTPQIWVEKSQQYLAEVLGETWQDEYYIWDCCAGTGNLLNGLTNYGRVWASTLDKQDVDVMMDRIRNGWNMFENHVFQFDFLNDDFEKCPEELREILADEEKRKKLVIYINPPYAEAGNKKELKGTGKNKDSLSENRIAVKYNKVLGKARNELYAQFFARIYFELKNCVLAEFSKTKLFQAINFNTFRKHFVAEHKKSFLVPAKTFDNVKGEFPIGFFIWETKSIQMEKYVLSDVFDDIGGNGENKRIDFFDEEVKTINKWISLFVNKDKKAATYGSLMYDSSDFQANDKIVITNRIYTGHHHYPNFVANNIIPFCIYLAVRLVIPHTWLNDRDQFLYPDDGWETDAEFQSDCLIYTLFHGQNRISSAHGTNHWIPFTEREVGCKKAFKSHFMSDFLAGKIELEAKEEASLFNGTEKIESRAKKREKKRERGGGV